MAVLTVPHTPIVTAHSPSIGRIWEGACNTRMSCVMIGTTLSQVIQGTSAGMKGCYGFINEATVPTAGDPVTVYLPGAVVWVHCGDTVAAGDFLMPDDAGEVETYSVGNYIVAKTLEVGAVNEWVAAIITLGIDLDT